MKTLCRDIVISMILGFLLPGILLAYAQQRLAEEKVLPILEQETVAQATAPTETVPHETVQKASLPVYLQAKDGSIMHLDMDAYLTGVVLAEMPAFFEKEALKAQAVVARTYAWKAYTTGGKHGNGSVCGNSTCCQAYIPETDYLEQGGKQQHVEKIRNAVLETSGLVLTYEGALIEATYFSCSGGSTEAAAAVWGTDFPYLQSVSSPGEENAAYYSETKIFTSESFQEALGMLLPEDTGLWLGEITYTDGGGVDTMEIGTETFRGTQLRQLLGLKSTAFTLTIEEDCITVVTRGFGHRVGMSQYGADAMAAGGSNYKEILAYYYQGTAIETCRAENQDEEL